MKKWICAAVLTMTCLIAGSGIQARALSEGVLEYRIENDSCIVITGCQTDAQGTVEIPSELLGYPVVRIDASAFSGCTGITHITVPASVTDIGEEAFYGCTALESVALPEGLETLGARAFSGCTQLESISLPDGMTELGAYAFQNCSALTEISLPDGVPVLEQGLLSGCDGLQCIVLSDQTEQIGARFAQNDTALSELTVPASVTSIGDYAFQGCTALTDVTFEGDAPAAGISCFEANTVLHYYEGAEGWTQPTWNGYQTQEEALPVLTGIALSQTEVQMGIGDSVTLTASPVPQNAPLGTVSWTSSAPNIVSVQDGVLTAQSAGQATVTAASGSVSADCQVTVTAAAQPQSITLSATELSLYAGDTAQLTAQILPESASDYELTWTSSDEQIASVENGMVTAVGGGTAYITASAGEVQAVCTVTVGLSTPVLLTPESTCLAVTVRWQPVAGAETYQILRRTDGDWAQIAEISGQQTDSYADSSGAYDTQYSYTVRACDGAVTSEYDPAGVSGRRVLGQPVLDSAVSVDDQTVHIAWQAVPGAEAYRLYRKSGTSNWKKMIEFDGTAYDDTGLTCGTEYIYTVRAVWQGKLSTYDETGVSAVPVPAAPVLKRAQALVGLVRVEWEAVARASGYRVYRKSAGAESWTRIATVGSGVTQYEDTAAEDDIVYIYTVRAYRTVGTANVAGRYDAAGVTGCTRPQAPMLVSAEALSTGNQIRWNAVTGAEGYYIYRRTEDSNWSRVGVSTRGSTVFLDTRAQAGVIYRYTVRAYRRLNGSMIYSSYEDGLTVTTAS